MASLLTLPLDVLRGARFPRVEVRPPITGTQGDLAIDLMAAAGKPLEPWQCDSVNLMLATRADGKWACYEYAEWLARQNGKGGLGEARVLTGLLVLDEELLMWSAHEYKTALEAFRRVRALVRNLGRPVTDNLVEIDDVPVKISNTNGEEGFERLDTGQRLKFLARSKSSGRGFTGDVNVIDESFAFTVDQQDALMPTLIARPNAQIIYLSSPPLTGTSGPVMYSLKTRAEAGGDDSLGYRDWGIEGCLDELPKIDLDDRRLWAQANPALGLGRVTEETIGRLRKAMAAKGGEGFAREVLGLWWKQRDVGGAIDIGQWATLLNAASRREGDVTLAVDIAPQRDYAATGLFGQRADGVGHWQIVDYRPGTEWLVDRIVELRQGLDPVVIAMGRSTAGSLEIELGKRGITRPEDPEKPQRGDLVVLSAAEMTASTGQALDAVRQGSVRHIGQPPLDAAVAGAKTRETGETVAWSRKDADADISPLVVVSEARWAYFAFAHLTGKGDEPFNIW